MSLSKCLDDYSIFNRIAEEKKNTIRHVFDNIEPILSRITEMFPDYTPHGLNHILELIRCLERILETQIANFNDDQLFCLLVATILHDVGMVHNLFPEDDWEINEESRIAIRDNHHLRSQRFVKEILEIDIPLEIRKAIGLIAKGHRKISLSEKEYTVPSGKIENLDVLSASLRLADELDFTYGRIEFLELFSDKSVFLSKLPSESISFWKSHMILKCWKINRNQNYLFIEGEVCDLEGHLALEYMKQKIQKTLDGIRNIKFNGEYIFPFSTLFEIDFKGFIDANYHVEIDGGIIGTIIGSIYKEKIEAIRECIQNSIDACLIQKAIQTEYVPEISVKLEDNVISVLDNGCGMTKHIIEHYLRVVGRSYYQSPEFASLQHDLGESISVVGMYGVGIFSLLLLTDSICIQTCSSQNGGENLEVQMTHSFTPIYEIEQMDIKIDHGTSLTFNLTIENYTYIRENILSFLNYVFPRPSTNLKVILDATEKEIGIFPISEVGTISEPRFSLEDNHVSISGLTNDGIFLGLSDDFTLVEYGQRKNLEQEDDSNEDWNTQIIIALGGSRIASFEFDIILYSPLKLLTNLIKEITPIDIIYPFIDFPVGRILPTLSKTDILEGERLIKKTQESIINLIQRCVIQIREIYYREGKIEKFWDYLTGGNYVAGFISDFNMNEIIHNIEFWKPGVNKRVKDFGAGDEKTLNMSRILNEFSPNPEINPNDGWIPLGHYEFVRDYLIIELRKRGWHMNFPLMHYNFTEDYEWEHIEAVLLILEDKEKEEAIRSIIYCLSSASEEFLRWIASELVNNNWINLDETISNPESYYLALYKLRYFVTELKNQSPDDLFDSAASKLNFDDFLNLMITAQRYDEGFVLLKEKIESGLEFEFAYSLWNSLKFNGYMCKLEQRFADDFQPIKEIISELKEKHLDELVNRYSF